MKDDLENLIKLGIQIAKYETAVQINRKKDGSGLSKV
jgi:hypothetical protein